MRAKAPRVEVPVERTLRGEIRVNLTAIMLQPDVILLLESDPLLRCLRAYCVPQERLEEIQTQHHGAVVCGLSDNYLALPPKFADEYIGEENRLLAISLETPEADCIELWNPSAWRSLEMRFGSAALIPPMPLLTAASEIRRCLIFPTPAFLLCDFVSRLSTAPHK